MSEKWLTDVVENDGSNGEQLLLFPELDEEEFKWQSTDTTNQTTVKEEHPRTVK